METLQEFCSEFWDIEQDMVTDELAFDSSLDGFSSIRFFQFLTVVESNFDVELSNPVQIKTFGDLAVAVGK